MLRIFVFLLVFLTSPALSLARESDPHDASGTPTEVARSYFKAMDSKDLDAAEALFAKTSSIFETGGNEGDWKQYRAHHIGAELDSIKTFETTLGDPEDEISSDGAMAFVAWPIEYHIILQDGREIDSRGTVTFVLVQEEGSFRIRHLHWSSRRKQGDSH
jgi:ketosteroid isomerase-like protein